MKTARPRSAWLPPAYEIADAYALQALERGEADPSMQKRALAWVIQMAAGTYEVSYRSGADGDRETAFAEGRRFVGIEIVKLLKLNTAKLAGDENG